MSGSTDPIPSLKTALAAITDVTMTCSKNKSNRFLFLRFNDPRWINYFLEELFFRFFSGNGKLSPIKRFANVPTQAYPNGLLLQIPAEMGFDLKTISVFTAPPPGSEMLAEHQFTIELVKNLPALKRKTKAG